MEDKISNSDIFDENTHQIRWYHKLKHLGYYLSHWFKQFFKGPFYKSQVNDLDLLQQVKLLLDTENTTPVIIDKCSSFIYLHRIVENTHARRRLEKWASKTIAIYLLVVLCIVFFNYIHIPKLSGFVSLEITDNVIIIILSTTTVNIIGLGLIVLRGHFLSQDNNNNIEESRKRNNRDKQVFKKKTN